MPRLQHVSRQFVWALLAAAVLGWAGCQYVGEVQQVLRAGQRDALRATATAVATALPALGSVPKLGQNGVYAARVTGRIAVDARDDDWAAPMDGETGRVRLATDGDRLYLYLSLDDDQVVWSRGAFGTQGDHLELRLGAIGQGQRWLLSWPGVGPAQAFRADGVTDFSLRGAMRQTPAGFDAEWSIPLPDIGSPIQLIRHDHDAANRASAEQFLIPAGPGLASLIYTDSRWDQRLQRLAPEQVKLTLHAPDGGWLLGGSEITTNMARIPWWWRWFASDPEQPAVTRSDVLDQAVTGVTAAHTFKQADGTLWQAVFAPVSVDGAVFAVVAAQQDDRHTAQLASQALGQVMLWSFAAVLVVVLVLALSRLRLSLHVRRLRKTLAGAVDARGQIAEDAVARLTTQSFGAELTDIAGTAAQLLERQRLSADYLESLAGKLAHELRTPLTVVRSSLEHVQADATDAQLVYVQRARDGLTRLESLLGRMREARAVEQALQVSDRESFDLAVLVTNAMDGYAASFPNKTFHCEVPKLRCAVLGMPELIRQMLDKLIENAVDFCADDGQIEVTLVRQHKGYRLMVANDGPLLPDASQSRLFEAMVSLREGHAGTPHFGLGLSVVHSIVAGHHGRVFGRNRADGSGVEFVVELPLEG